VASKDKGRKCERGGDESEKLESQWMTFLIKKRINTEHIGQTLQEAYTKGR